MFLYLTSRDVIGRRALPAWDTHPTRNRILKKTELIFMCCLKHEKALNHVLTLFCNTILIQIQKLMRMLEKLPPPAILRMFLLLWKFLSGVSSCSSFGWVTPTPLDQIIVNGHNYSRFNLPPHNVDLLWGPGPTSVSWLVSSFSAHHRRFVYFEYCARH